MVGTEKANSHLQQLDGLRAIAALAVFAQHWLPMEALMMGLRPGYLGVRFFFVLSGFLITGILLRCRSNMDDGRQSLGYSIKAFYARRFLRIFPLYYAILLFAILVNFEDVRGTAFFHLGFLSNVSFALRDESGPISPFWSLAVEEQFYLFWPWVVLLTPGKHLRKVIISAILLSLSYRAIGIVAGWRGWTIDFQLISCLDALGLGALLADLRSSNEWEFIKNPIFSLTVAGAGILAIFIIFSQDMARNDHPFRIVFLSFAAAMVSFVVIRHAVQGITGPIGALLQSRPMAYLGKISYGLYALHIFVPSIAVSLGISMAHNMFLLFTLYSAMAIAMASFSWRFYERPINDLKSKFPYQHVL